MTEPIKHTTPEGRIAALAKAHYNVFLLDAEDCPIDLVRLAFPRRVYTQSHFDYMIEVLEDVWKNRDKIPGYRMTYQPKFLRHFSCHFEIQRQFSDLL